MGTYSAEEYFYKVDNMVHSSCQVLSKLFQTRWKRETGKTWEHTEKQGRQFIEGEGKLIHRNAGNTQRTAIATGCLDAWDVSLLSMVLQNFGKRGEYEAENEAVRKLTGMRNDLVHRNITAKKLSYEQYNEKVELFREILRALHVKNEVIDKMVEKAGLTSSVSALDATKKLFEMGEESMKAGDFEKAIVCFDEATTMPSLLPVHQAAAFEKRAETYLQLAYHKKQNQHKIEADKCCEQALLDATEALGLNENSWKAHHLLARCHRWQNHFDEAISHCQTALAISPAQKQVKAELDSCKALSGWRKREETTDPRNLPVSLAEALENVEVETGYKLSEKEFINYKTAVEGKVFKGQENVFRGLQYRMGWSVPQSDEEAARYYAKAAKEGNAEGIFNLGLCYRHGNGVKQDLDKAYQLYLQAAQMPADIAGMHSYAKKNVGVVSAQHCVGFFHEYGIVVKQDHSEAAMWYKKATENGNGTSAYNLGLMYAQGRGVPRSIKSAEMYWNQGVIFEEPKAAEELMKYYIHQLEPERARNMFQTGRRLESVALNGISEDEFNTMIQLSMVHRKKAEADVLKYENQNKLSIKGMTFLERLQRYSFTLEENKAKLLKNLADVACNAGQNWGGRMKEWKYSDLEQMVKLAHLGSSTADRVVKSMLASSNLCFLIGEKNNFTEEEKMKVLNLSYEFLTLNLSTGTSLLLPPDGKLKLAKVIADLFGTKLVESKGEDVMKVRFCFALFTQLAFFGTSSDMTMDLLQKGITTYPDNMYYYEAVTNLYGLNGDHREGLYYAEKGLEKFPDNADLLYAKAGHLHLQPKPDWKESIATYKKFLLIAPPDDRKVPEAYYSIASLCRFDVKRDRKERSAGFSKMELYLILGKEAEGNMLPCYLPYESSNKLGVEHLINFAKLLPNEPSASSKSSPLTPKALPTQDDQALKPSNILDKKQYLTSPVRKRIILEHRRNMLKFSKMKLNLNIMFGTPISKPPKLRQTTPKTISRVSPITLKDMDPTTDTIYEERIIEFTIVEDPCYDFNPNTIHIVAEDENGDLTRLYLYNIPHDKETKEKVKFGCRIAILNPYMRIGSFDGTNGIRNDEPKCVIYLGEIKNMCRFCGEENAANKCSKCNWASYCNRECQTLDWQMMKHKLICSTS